VPHSDIAIVHLDESCLGNGREGDNPGGAGGLIEARARGGIERRDLYLSSPATTNNQMALAGATEVLELLAAKGARLRVLIVSDSEYLVKGMREWAPSWERRGWTRKGGPIENLGMWQALVEAARLHDAQFTWVRGHKGHAKNEYANDLAIRAAREQIQSDGVVASGFPAWLEQKRAKKLYQAYDPDESFESLERQVASGARIPLR
jgi:ribonuclease HI